MQLAFSTQAFVFVVGYDILPKSMEQDRSKLYSRLEDRYRKSIKRKNYAAIGALAGGLVIGSGLAGYALFDARSQIKNLSGHPQEASTNIQTDMDIAIGGTLVAAILGLVSIGAQVSARSNEIELGVAQSARHLQEIVRSRRGKPPHSRI